MKKIFAILIVAGFMLLAFFNTDVVLQESNSGSNLLLRNLEAFASEDDENSGFPNGPAVSQICDACEANTVWCKARNNKKCETVKCWCQEHPTD